VAARILAGDRRLHAIVQDLDRHAADRGERLHVTAQQGLQILVQDEARLDVPGMPEHQREQPDDAGRVRCREGDDEAGEVDPLACWPAGVSKRTSQGLASAGRIAATNRFTAV
jgi:hypothetical protein